MCAHHSSRFCQKRNRRVNGTCCDQLGFHSPYAGVTPPADDGRLARPTAAAKASGAMSTQFSHTQQAFRGIAKAKT